MHSISQHECNENAQNKKSVNAFYATKEQPSRTVVHAKLEMTDPDSPEEVEADAAANEIVQGGKIARSIFAGSAGGGISVSSQMEGRLNSMQGGGQVMPDGLRNMMERGFNRDFSQVRLHTDSEAASLSSSIHAKAFTHGNDIYFNQGQFSPNTSEGQKLMAHELTHVVQGGEKVGRMTDEEKKSRSHYDINYYIKEIDWIKNDVLRPQRFEKFQKNYEKTSDRVPVTVVFFTTKESSNDAFEDSLNSLFDHFENDSKENGKKILMIQGQPNMFGHKLIDIAVSYGPIENVIVAGHGSPWSVELGKKSEGKGYSIESSEEKIFANIAYAFNLSDKEQKGLNHSVLFDECLVGSRGTDDDSSFIDYAYTKINEKTRKSKVFVRGNKSATWNDSVYYRDKDGYLKFRNTVDETTTIDGKTRFDFSDYDNPQSYNNDNSEKPYAKTGKEILGLMLSYMRIADDPMAHQNFCSSNLEEICLSNLEERTFMDEDRPVREGTALYIEDYQIRPRDFVRFIESKHCNMSMPDSELLYLKNFLIFLYNEWNYDKNKTYILLDESASLDYLEFLYTNYNI